MFNPSDYNEIEANVNLDPQKNTKAKKQSQTYPFCL